MEVSKTNHENGPDVSGLFSSDNMDWLGFNAFDCNFNDSLDLPPGEWLLFRVNLDAFNVVNDEFLSHQVTQVLPPVGKKNSDFSESQLSIRLHKFVFKQNFED